MLCPMSAKDMLQQVKAWPPQERLKFFGCVQEVEGEAAVPSSARGKRPVLQPDAPARRGGIFGGKVLPNLVLLAGD